MRSGELASPLVKTRTQLLCNNKTIGHGCGYLEVPEYSLDGYLLAIIISGV